ncbi:MAG: resolvase [Lysobacterales bacterium 14-68-21]|jgi:DNA invertase Pin-like site-specific DNA recombinase|nr:MAG: resolvase [Xanthomonadales bacterium 14-68-21]
MKIISYLRVSTAKQGKSGLGLEAQREAIEQYARERSASVIETFTEVESGKVNSRPELGKALHLSKLTGAILVIAKLDRLSRNAAFLLALKDSGVRFIAADMPDANDLTVGIMALVAQQERDAISRRTREALAAAKSRGTKLGNPNGAAALHRAGKGNAASLISIRAVADAHASDLRPIVSALANEGITSFAGIAAALNDMGILTPRNRSWHKSSVRNLLLRIRYLDSHSMEANRSVA